MIRIFKVLLFISTLTISSLGWSLTVEQAKQQGRIGETLTGYLAAIQQDKETLEFVETINQARTEKYQQIAAKNSISVNEVAKMTGKKLIDRATTGEYVRGINGMWVKK